MGLELVPLENGTFGMFEKRGGRGKRVIVGQEESKLFPGQEEMFCRHGIGREMHESLYEMAETGWCLLGFPLSYLQTFLRTNLTHKSIILFL
jgi:hypothetical protein